jgi:arginine/lysine/ornithine decarboxylase
MNKESAPLYDRLVRHCRERHAGFHVPGHKGGAGVDPRGGEFLRAVMAIDLTEITGLDDLHHPSGVIKEAQELAADCFGAEETFFLVGGSTAGNLALIMSLCEKNDILIVQRNVHKSILNGMAWAGVRAVFLPPKWDKDSRLSAGVRQEDVRAALERYPEAKGVMLTNPNYYGMADDLSAIAGIVHTYGKPLLVDEAHGAHLGFHPELPPSALSCGADGVVQSTHKMLTALTMGAMLHLQGTRLDRTAVRRCLGALQSSSPSYPILASLDLSRRQVHTDGFAFIETGLQPVRDIRRKAESLSALAVLEKSEHSAYDALDPFKLTVWDRRGTVNGFDLQRRLEERGCMTELADGEHVLLLFSPATPREDAGRLWTALEEMDRLLSANKQEKPMIPANISGIPRITGISLPVSFSWFGSALSGTGLDKVRTVPLAESAGKVAAEMIVPYPPGIPVLYPGERITTETRDYLLALAQAGARFQGAADSRLGSLLVTDP